MDMYVVGITGTFFFWLIELEVEDRMFQQEQLQETKHYRCKGGGRIAPDGPSVS